MIYPDKDTPSPQIHIFTHKITVNISNILRNSKTLLIELHFQVLVAS